MLGQKSEVTDRNNPLLDILRAYNGLGKRSNQSSQRTSMKLLAPYQQPGKPNASTRIDSTVPNMTLRSLVPKAETNSPTAKERKRVLIRTKVIRQNSPF